MLRYALLLLALLPTLLAAQTATLDAPDSAVIGNTIDVRWSGPGTQYDQIAVFPVGATDSDKSLEAKNITSGKNPIPIRLPETAGSYELRYLAAGTGEVLGSRTITVEAIDTSLEAPQQVKVGNRIEVTWSGPGNLYDLVSLYPAGAADDATRLAGSTVRQGRSTVEFQVPEEPGEYELRYLTAKEKFVLARRSVTVTDTTASLVAPEQAGIGERIKVEWEGPGNTYDIIALHTVGAPDDARPQVSRSITSNTSPAQLRMPEAPGEYELRYQLRKSKRTLATRPIVVLGAGANLDAPGEAAAGSKVAVSWEGPGNPYDLVALYPAGAADDADYVTSRSITSKRNPVTLRLPETPGDFELRYQLAKTKQVLARRPLVITPVTANLQAPEQAIADTPLPVTWEGPGNVYDSIDLHPAGAPDDAEPVAGRSITGSRRNPVIFTLPTQNGEYELRYVTAQTKQVLARRALSIQPAGRLSVSYEGEGEIVHRTAADSNSAVGLILDASGSMLQRLDGKRRIEIAREALTDIVNEHLPDGQRVALRVFGHRTPDACQTDLEIPLAPLNRDAMSARIASINAMNLAKTPIADSLAKVPSDLGGASGTKSVILITDGEETCDGDPAQVITSLRDQGLDIQVSIVGFAIDDDALRAEFEQWAKLGGGSYFNADSADELLRSLRTVISGPYRVLDSNGKEAGRGVIGGVEVVLPPGTYRVETLGASPRVIENVVIEPEEVTEVAFN
jgi:hypothetical protein